MSRVSDTSDTLRARILAALLAYERALRERQWAEDAIPDGLLSLLEEPQPESLHALAAALDEVSRRRIELVELVSQVTA